MSTTETQEYTGRELRWLADAYEQAQRIRIETGERIRAVLQGRDETFTPLGSIEETPDGTAYWIDPDGVTWLEPDAVLKAITAHDSPGPVPILSRTYSRHHHEERELYAEMMGALKAHPAWAWLDQVKGIGPTLGCKLLARLDATKANTASAFWAYCGLATVPATEYRCDTCGLVRAWPVSYQVTGTHGRLGSTAKCEGSLAPTGREGVRCAQPKPGRGQKAEYDQYAKKILYLVGTSFLKSVGSPYDRYYRQERAKVDREKVGWADGRRHFWALRKTEKLFLSHLWQTWRETLGLPAPDPWVLAFGGHDDKLEPGDMV